MAYPRWFQDLVDNNPAPNYTWCGDTKGMKTTVQGRMIACGGQSVNVVCQMLNLNVDAAALIGTMLPSRMMSIWRRLGIWPTWNNLRPFDDEYRVAWLKRELKQGPVILFVGSRAAAPLPGTPHWVVVTTYNEEKDLFYLFDWNVKCRVGDNTHFPYGNTAYTSAQVLAMWRMPLFGTLVPTWRYHAVTLSRS